MNTKLLDLPLEQRLQLVTDLWDSIVAEEGSLPLTDWQRAELEQRLKTYELDGNAGPLAYAAIAEIRKKL